MDDYSRWVVLAQACHDAGCSHPAVKTFQVEPAPEPTPIPDPFQVSFPSGLMDIAFLRR